MISATILLLAAALLFSPTNHTSGSGGAINADNSTLNLADVNFTNNHATYYGGAIFTDRATLNLTVSDSKTSLFSGNTDNNGTANSLFLDYGSTLNVDTQGSSVLDMRDPMRGRNAAIITKTGSGLWKLGGDNTVQGTLDIQEGTFQLLGTMEDVDITVGNTVSNATLDVSNSGKNLKSLTLGSNSLTDIGSSTLNIGSALFNGGEIRYSGSSGKITGTTATFTAVETEFLLPMEFGTYTVQSGAAIRPNNQVLTGDVNLQSGSYLYLKAGEKLEVQNGKIITFAGDTNGTANIIIGSEGVSAGTTLGEIISGDWKIGSDTSANVGKTAAANNITLTSQNNTDRKVSIKAATGSAVLFTEAVLEDDSIALVGKVVDVVQQQEDLDSANNTISGLQTDKTNLTNQVNQLTTDKTDLTNQVNQLTTDKTNLTNQVNMLTAQLATAYGDNTALLNQITALEKQIKAKDTEIAAKDTQINDLNTQISGLQSQITGLNTQINNLQNQIAALSELPLSSTANEVNGYTSIRGGAAGTFANSLVGYYKSGELQSDIEKKAFLDSLLAGIFAAPVSSAQRNVLRFDNAIYNRLAEPSTKQSSADKYCGQSRAEQREFWFEGFGDWTRVNPVSAESSGLSGFNVNTGGFTLGVDKRLSWRFLVGLGFSGIYDSFHNRAVSAAGSASGEGESYLGDFYGKYDGEMFSAAFTAGYVRGDYDIERRVGVNTLKSSQNIDTDFASFELSLPFRCRTIGSISPIYGLEYANFDVGGFKEYVGHAVVNTVDGRNAETLMQTVGLRWTKSYRGLSSSLTAAWRHDYCGDGAVWTMQYAGGSPLTIRGASSGLRNRVLLSYNLTAELGRGWSVFGGYTGELADGLTVSTVQGGAGWKF